MNNENMSFTYKSYENQYDISKSTAKRDLSNLMSHNLIRRIIIDQTYYFMIWMGVQNLTKKWTPWN